MKTTFYLNGKKTSRKALTGLLGENRIRSTSRKPRKRSSRTRSPRTAFGLAAEC